MSLATAPCTLPERQAEPPRLCPSSNELWRRYHQPVAAPVENELVEQYLPLVRVVLGRLAMTLPEHADRDNLHSAGLVGLLQALRNFDPASGASFESYARTRIRGAMIDELRRTDWAPRGIHEKARKLQTRIAELEQRLGGAASEAEIAAELGISRPEYEALLDELRPAAFVCLDATCGDEGNDSATYGDLVADTAVDGPFEEASRSELTGIIREKLNDLPQKQRQVLALYYHEDLNLREIAAAMGLTESRVCQIHSQAIISLRAHVRRLENTCNAGGGPVLKS